MRTDAQRKQRDAILRKNWKETPGIKNTVTETKSGFDGLISSLDTAKERLSEFNI